VSEKELQNAFLHKAAEVLNPQVKDFNQAQQSLFLSSLKSLYDDLEDPMQVTKDQLQGVIQLVDDLYPQEFKELQEVYSEQTPPN
tara:strand:+ start:157 stop:411 length:255 start_codon:yes stop_codon:yes gene_type:complete